MPAPLRRASVADHSLQRPDRLESDGAPSWITRGANFVIAITQARPGTRLAVEDQDDEYMVLLPDGGARITVAGATRTVGANSLAIVPPGPSQVVAETAGTVVRCFSARRADLMAQAGNGAAFTPAPADVAPPLAWPAPTDGFALRVYDLDAGLAEGDKTRVYRSANLMINILREREEARDMRAMSPHSHADFEQGSITLAGVHVHHLRTPWGPDMSAWRADEAVEVGAPSVTVIPPQLIHTTRNMGDGRALLVDLFCPPRADFARRPGMVRNASEYPLPPHLTSGA